MKSAKEMGKLATATSIYVKCNNITKILILHCNQLIEHHATTTGYTNLEVKITTSELEKIFDNYASVTVPLPGDTINEDDFELYYEILKYSVRFEDLSILINY